MTKITSRLLLMPRLKLEKDTALALPCIVREGSRGKPQTCSTPTDASQEQAESENTGACEGVKRKHMDHIAEKVYVGSFSLWPGTQASQEATKIPEAKAPVKT